MTNRGVMQTDESLGFLGCHCGSFGVISTFKYGRGPILDHRADCKRFEAIRLRQGALA